MRILISSIITQKTVSMIVLFHQKFFFIISLICKQEDLHIIKKEILNFVKLNTYLILIQYSIRNRLSTIFYI